MAGTQRILYNDKETFQTSPLAEINKATAANYNELKDVTNNNGVEQDKITPSPNALTDSASIAFNLNSNLFDLKTLDTAQAAITLTLSNVVAGANQILSIKKTIAGDVTITLAGTGLTFYGYNDADLNTSPVIILSGLTNDIFDLSFLARTATEIGVAIGVNGN